MSSVTEERKASFDRCSPFSNMLCWHILVLVNISASTWIVILLTAQR